MSLHHLLHGVVTARDGVKKVNEASDRDGSALGAAATGGGMTAATLFAFGAATAPVAMPLVAAGAVGGAALYGLKKLFK